MSARLVESGITNYSYYRHGSAEVSGTTRYGGIVHVPAPARIAVDPDVGRPAVQADVRQFRRGVVLADA